MNSDHSLLLWGIGALGAGSIGAAIYWFIFNRYSEIESTVIQRISTYAAEIYDYLDRLYKRQSMERCYVMILVPTILFGFIGLIAGFKSGILTAVVAAIVLGMVGYRIPGLIVKKMFAARVAKFDKQLVDALNMMANAIKSGLSFLQVIQVIEREMPAPCSEEFGMVLKENRVGINLNDALMNMTKRVPSEDLFMIVNSVVTLSQQGGDLSEAFDTIAATIRDRQRVFEKIRTLAQAGITQGFILAGFPFVMLGMMYIMQPTYIMLLFTTPLGLALFGGMIVLILFGAIWMKKILTIDI